MNPRPPLPGGADTALRKLQALEPLSAAEATLISQLVTDRQVHEAGAELTAEGERIRPLVILSGWACRARRLPDGRQQIFNFLLPGDTAGLEPESPALASYIALTRVVTASAQPVADWLNSADPTSSLPRALAKARAMERASLLDQIVRLGRQTAYARMAHLLLELHSRLLMVGMASERRFPFPLTQELLADAVGLSVVHVNRTLQQLRREGLIELRHGQVELLQTRELANLCGFSSPV